MGATGNAASILKIHTPASPTHSFNHSWAKSSSRAGTSGRPRHSYRGQNYLTSLLMTHAMGQSTSSASFAGVADTAGRCAAIQSTADSLSQQGAHQVQREGPHPAPGEE